MGHVLKIVFCFRDCVANDDHERHETHEIHEKDWPQRHRDPERTLPNATASRVGRYGRPTRPLANADENTSVFVGLTLAFSFAFVSGAAAKRRRVTR